MFINPNENKQYTKVAPKRLKIRTIYGELSAAQAASKNLPYGLYSGFDDYVGPIIHWHIPPLEEDNFENLIFAITHINQYETLSDKYRELIQTDSMVKWHLIPCLICGQAFKEQLPALRDIPNWSTPQLLENKVLFLDLAKQGAEYKHSISYGYSAVRLDYLKIFLGLFGEEATLRLNDELTLISFHLTTYYDKAAIKKVKMLLEAGADINERVDKYYNNTILHYLIACETEEDRIIELIDLTEKMSELSNNSHRFKINYTLPDNHGKTALYLAVGLGMARVVEKLLDLAKNSHQDIGLNLPDQAGRTPLMIAAALGHENILKKLIQSKASLFIKDQQDRDVTWYMQAPDSEVRAILKFLSIHPDRGYYVKKHSYLYSLSNDGCPLVLIDSNENEKELLLSRKAPYFDLLRLAVRFIASAGNRALLTHVNRQMQALNESAGPHYHRTILDRCLDNQRLVRSFIQENIFRVACALGDLDTVKKCIAVGVNINAQDHFGRTALHFTVMRQELVSDILRSQNSLLTVEYCMQNHSRLFEYLIQQGADISITNSNGKSPLQLLSRDSFSVGDELTSHQAKTMLGFYKKHLSQHREATEPLITQKL
jgi:ankyrin repeat protein